MKNLIWVLFISIVSFSMAQNYVADWTFNTGTGFTDVNYSAGVNSTVIQSDGKVLVGGWFTNYNGTPQNHLTRLNPDGTVDLNFNTGTGFDHGVSTIKIQSDGKILVGGDFTNYNGTPQNKITRLNSDGSIDLSFNTGTGFNENVSTINIQSDGKIIVGGLFNNYNGTLQNKITRLNLDGSIDLSFNTGTGFNDYVHTIKIQSDGKILVSGWFTIYNGTNNTHDIARLNPDGTVDLTFNTGYGFIAYGGGRVNTINLQPDGKILVGGGDFYNYNGNNISGGLTRLNPDGTLDLTFNTGTGFNNSNIYATNIQSDGKLVVGGQFQSYNGTSQNNLTRLNPDGSIDLTFNTGTGISGTVYTTEYLSDGRIVVGGEFNDYNGVTADGLVRLRPCTITPINQIIDETSCGVYTSSTGQTYTQSGTYVEVIPNIYGCDSINRTINLTVNASDYTGINYYSQNPSCTSPADGLITVNLNSPGTIQGSGILISEYYSGPNQDKVLEIYNLNNTSIDLGATLNSGNGFNSIYGPLYFLHLKNSSGATYYFPNNTIVPANGTILISNPNSTIQGIGILSTSVIDGSTISLSAQGSIGQPINNFEVVTPILNQSLTRKNTISNPNQVFNVNEWNNLPLSLNTLGIHYNVAMPTYEIHWTNGYVGNTLSNISNGTYSYSVVHTPSGCVFNTNSITIQASVYDSFSDTICDGESYSWNGQQYTQSGLYTQILTNQFGCDSTVTLNLNVNYNDWISVNPNPAFGNAPLNVAFANQTANLSNYNFTWYFGDGSSQQSNAPFLSHIYTQDGYADVTVVAENLTTGCSSSETFNDMIFVIGGVTCTHSATINQTGPLTGCVGDSILLSSNTDPTFTYQWNRNGIPVSGATSSSFYPTQSGSYTVTIYQNNCPVTSAGISVTMNALPAAPTITSNGTITPCSGGSMTLTAPSGLTTYLWNTGATTNSINVSQSGNYFVTVTNSLGCERTSNLFPVNASNIAPPQVCIVGMDSLTNENRIVWEKPLTSGIDSFYVYKESNVSNVYTKIGATDYNDLAVFLNVNSNPAVQAYRYKISALDTCGVETNVGDFHKTIHLTINQGVGGALNLIWSHYEGLNFGSYNIYRGTDPSNISLLTTIQSNLNSYTDLTPPSGAVYYQIEVVNPVNCDPTKVLNYGVSRSNIVNNGQSSINEELISTIQVYPNPTNDKFTLEVSNDIIGKTYFITDFAGRVIQQGKINSIKKHIDLQTVSNGSYFLQVEGKSIKVVKQY